MSGASTARLAESRLPSLIENQAHTSCARNNIDPTGKNHWKFKFRFLSEEMLDDALGSWAVVPQNSMSPSTRYIRRQ